MRIISFSIINYKGIERASLDELEDLPAIIFTGKNGTGKSLLLEALVFAWSTRYPRDNRVGPWGDETEISVSVSLSASEVDRVRAWHKKAGKEIPESGDLTATITRTLSTTGSDRTEERGIVATLRDVTFQRENPFAIIDFLPSTRQLALGGNAAVDLGIFSATRQNEERESLVDAYMTNRGPVNLQAVPTYLLSLDYQNLIAARQGLSVDDDYELITEPFRAATGKTIHLPKFVPEKGSAIIEVELPSGSRHDLSLLSSGEQELLALQYFVRRLQATGGVLLLDEPEQHLHPSLQSTFLGNIERLSDASQILVVSHSAVLISSAPTGSVVSMSAPTGGDRNQVELVFDHSDRVLLIAELGLRMSDFVQADYLLIVEGESDAKWLRAMFPTELSRAQVVVAGSSKQVLSMCTALTAGETLLGVPWLAILDRDFLSEEQVIGLETKFPSLFVHGVREVESIFLDPDLIARVLSGVGLDVSVEGASKLLDEAASGLTDDVSLQIARAEMERRFPPPSVTDGDKWERWRSELAEYEDLNRKRLAEFDAIRDSVTKEVATRWEAEKLTLADPKIVLRRLQLSTDRFRDDEALTMALAAHIRRCPDELPANVAVLRERLRTVLDAE